MAVYRSDKIKGYEMYNMVYFTSGVSTTPNVPIFADNGLEVPNILIYGGARPTDIEDSVTLKTYTPLLKMGGTNTLSIQEGNAYFDLNTGYAKAITPGTATWAGVMTAQYPNGTYWRNDNYCYAILTIGGIGSGADIEMVDTDIDSSKYYAIKNLRITSP